MKAPEKGYALQRNKTGKYATHQHQRERAQKEDLDRAVRFR